jgi:hypothetical protein
MWNTQILLFPYDRNESFLYRSFKHWVPPPPNPPPMTDEEKEEATTVVFATHHCANVGTNHS